MAVFGSESVLENCVCGSLQIGSLKKIVVFNLTLREKYSKSCSYNEKERNEKYSLDLVWFISSRNTFCPSLQHIDIWCCIKVLALCKKNWVSNAKTILYVNCFYCYADLSIWICWIHSYLDVSISHRWMILFFIFFKYFHYEWSKAQFICYNSAINMQPIIFKPEIYDLKQLTSHLLNLPQPFSWSWSLGMWQKQDLIYCFNGKPVTPKPQVK